MTRIHVWLLPAALGALLALSVAGVAAASPAGAAVAADDNGSFASAFFISKRTAPDGTTSIELLGSLVIWFLFLLSILSIGLIGSMAFTNQRRSIMPPGVVKLIGGHLKHGRFKEARTVAREDGSFFSRVLSTALEEANHGYNAMIHRLELTADELTTVRLRRIELLNVLGQVSPMIGLFGTVYGMILAFRSIVVSGGNADPILLAGGIGTALTTTFWGLVVAIPALAGYALIRNRIDELTTEATGRAEQLLLQFRPRSGVAATGDEG